MTVPANYETEYNYPEGDIGLDYLEYIMENNIITCNFI